MLTAEDVVDDARVMAGPIAASSGWGDSPFSSCSEAIFGDDILKHKTTTKWFVFFPQDPLLKDSHGEKVLQRSPEEFVPLFGEIDLQHGMFFGIGNEG